MNKYLKIVGSAMTFALSNAMAQTQAPAQADLPAPKIGEVWKYRTIDRWNNTETGSYQEELVDIQPNRLVFRSRSSRSAEPKTIYYGRSLASCRQMHDSQIEMCDGSLAFPLRVGNKSNYDKRPWRNGNGHDSAACEVKAVEQVTVPAGTFDAFRVECEGNWIRVAVAGPMQGNAGRYEETIWYSPKVNRSVKSAYTAYGTGGRLEIKNQTELVEFVAK